MSGVVANKRNTESKYVSVFADSRPDVDVTFSQELLDRPTDHFMVGVDNLTVSLNSLSMLDLEDGDVLRLGRYRKTGAGAYYNHALDPQQNIDDALNVGQGVNPELVFPPIARFSITSGKTNGMPFYNVHQFMRALREMADYINQTVMGAPAGLPNGAGQYFVGYAHSQNDAGPANEQHLSFELRSDGKIEVIGTRAFWANFFFRIEKPKYQRILDSDRVATGAKYIGLKVGAANGAGTGARSDVGILGTTAGGNPMWVFYNQGAEGADDPNGPGNVHAVLGNAEIALLYDAGHGAAAAFDYRNTKLRLVLGGNIWSTLDRRIALEMGCSLPVQNSPMVDHNKEAPDFVIGRWIYNPRARQFMNSDGTGGTNDHMSPSVVEFQNSTDRVQYHTLMPQEKIQTIRLKLFVRVREYTDESDTFAMKTIQCPTVKTDWWHTRLHFVSKD